MTERDMEILRVFADSDMNCSRTGRALYLHSNSVRYRLDVIRRDTGLDPYRFWDLVKLLGMEGRHG